MRRAFERTRIILTPLIYNHLRGFGFPRISPRVLSSLLLQRLSLLFIPGTARAIEGAIHADQ